MASMSVGPPLPVEVDPRPPEKGPSAADAVRSFYDRHPYPPPINDLEAYARRWVDPRRRQAESFLLWPDEPYRDNRSILVAGCGTSQAAKYALRWPHAHVTGIDVSETSLRHTERLARRYGLGNLELRPLPVERATELDRSFDLVICTGVLHHLPDPDAGLMALRSVMSPRAAMEVMVYAPYGRTGVYLLQDYCRRIGVGTSSEAIDALVLSLRSLAQDHPFAALLRHAPDLQHRAGLADALLHPRDRPYSVPQLLDFLGRNGLRFGRWLRQAPYLPHCGALATSPHRRLLAELPIEEQYAAVELFRGTMTRHTAIVYRNDRGAGPERVEFDDDRWTGWVPVRVPDTIAVDKKLPAGAAAVLINPRHTFTDLYLPIRAEELAWVEAIDGRRPITEIVGNPADRDVARTLFERLWWYDQVVFDASSPR